MTGHVPTVGLPLAVLTIIRRLWAMKRPSRTTRERHMEFGLTSSSLGNIILSTEYDLENKSLQFGRVVLNNNGFRYRNELVAKLADPWVGGEVLLAAFNPFSPRRRLVAKEVVEAA